MATGVPTVPAWKRLGLELKPRSELPPLLSFHTSAHPAEHEQTPQRPRSILKGGGGTSVLGKRKGRPGGASESRSAPQRENRGSNWRGEDPTSGRRVSFSNGTKEASATGTAVAKTPNSKIKKMKQNEPSGKNKKPAPLTNQQRDRPKTPPDLRAALEYLRLWRDRTSRPGWKFNKNHQTLLIKYVFDDGAIPTADIDTFYEYIRDLRGFVRTRLREAAAQARDRDEVDEDADGGREQQYRAAISELVRSGSFSETAYVPTATAAWGDGSPLVWRAVARMRAEMLLRELAGEEGATAGVAGAAGAAGAAGKSGGAGGARIDAKRIKPNDGRVTRARKARTGRTEAADQSSSSESSSGSEEEAEEEGGKKAVGDGGDDSSSSSSSSEESGSEDGDDEEERRGEDDESSSSSSSSEEDGEEEAEAEADTETEVEDDGSS